MSPPHKHGPVLGAALGLTVLVAAGELAGGLLSGSLALLADAAHVAMDAVALGIALAAAAGAARPATSRRTFGYARLEVLGALANGGLLFAVTILIVVEALHRFAVPVAPRGAVMALFAGGGFVVNVAIGIMLARAGAGNINVRAALFHVAGDAAGALAVAMGGIVVVFTRQTWIDPVLSLVVCGIILVGVWQVVREAADVLMESAPPHVTVDAVRAAIVELPGVAGVHDLHVWTLGPGAHALTGHVLLADAKISEASAILRAIDARVRAGFGITHVTVQFECETCAEDQRIVCTQAAPGG